MKLTEKELKRYARQIVFDKIGEKGQKRLKSAKVTFLGCGAIGTVASTYLTSSGVGYIKIIDRDIVELSNIQRQTLFDEEDIDLPKAIAAKNKLEKINPDIKIEAEVADFNPTNAEELIEGNLVIDATDNLRARFLLNDVCLKKKIPFTHGAAIKDEGRFMFIIPNKTACLRCLIPKIPSPGSLETCEIVGVFGPVPGIIGCLSAIEAIKYLVGFGDLLTGKLLCYDASTHTFDLTSVKKNPDCKACVKKDFEYLRKREREIVSLCGRKTYQVSPMKKLTIDLRELADKFEKNPEFEVKPTEYNLFLKYKGSQITLFDTGRMLIKGIDSKIKAKKLANSLLGG